MQFSLSSSDLVKKYYTSKQCSPFDLLHVSCTGPGVVSNYVCITFDRCLEVSMLLYTINSPWANKRK